MTHQEKKAYILLKNVIFHYHGLDEEEKENLEETARKIDALDELEWSYGFIAEDYFTSFDRARAYLNDIISDYAKKKRVEYIQMVWDANNLKGYITEMEVNAMLKLASDWNVKEELRELVLNNITSKLS